MTFEGVRPVLHLAFDDAPGEPFRHGTDGLRSPSRRVDPEEEAALDAPFDDLGQAGVPGFGSPAG